MFDFGPGEITVMVFLAILFFGPKKPPLLPGVAFHWSLSDWLRVGAALLAATAAFTLLSAARY